MSAVLYFFGSGLALFAGIALVLAMLGVIAVASAPQLKAIASLGTVVGLLLIGLSATPFPIWFYALLFALTFAWLVAERVQRYAPRRAFLRWLLAAVWLGAIAWEAPYHFAPQVPPLGRPRLVIVGDSVAAGTSENREKTWPTLLARKHAINVLDLSRAGATVQSALRRVREQGLDANDLVLLEIGGNDVLGITRAMDFEQHLDELLRLTCAEGRVVVMFELPVPPFHNRFAEAQRRLAARHGVILIPKRLFIGVLTGGRATSDSIHLTDAGHEGMAALVWDLLSSAYSP